jgi:hypothetical protein
MSAGTSPADGAWNAPAAADRAGGIDSAAGFAGQPQGLGLAAYTAVLAARGTPSAREDDSENGRPCGAKKSFSANKTVWSEPALANLNGRFS